MKISIALFKIVESCAKHCEKNPLNCAQSTVKKKMATGTFNTYNALRTKTLEERIKTHKKLQVIQTRQEECC